jgi:hypothetical protein
MGEKDRHPYPVPLKVYDETIRVLKSAVQKAKLGQDEELGAVRRLDEASRRLEHVPKDRARRHSSLKSERAHMSLAGAACLDGNPRQKTG